jgi:hypothetical protein
MGGPVLGGKRSRFEERERGQKVETTQLICRKHASRLLEIANYNNKKVSTAMPS